MTIFSEKTKDFVVPKNGRTETQKQFSVPISTSGEKIFF